MLFLSHSSRFAILCAQDDDYLIRGARLPSESGQTPSEQLRSTIGGHDYGDRLAQAASSSSASAIPCATYRELKSRSASSLAREEICAAPPAWSR